MSDGIGRFSRADAPGEAVELTPQLFKQIIHETLSERDRLDSETHKAHHLWIEEQMAMERERHQIEMDKRRAELEILDEAKKQALRWVLGLVLAGLAALVGIRHLPGGE